MSDQPLPPGVVASVDEREARKIYGEATTAFMGDCAKAAKEHGIHAFALMIMGSDGVRIASSGTDDEARAKMRTIATWLQGEIALRFGRAEGQG